MTTAAVILSHAKGQAIHARHEAHWRQWFSPIITITPWDDHILGTLPVGNSEHCGHHAIQRLITAAILASKFPQAAIIEYDTLILRHPGIVPAGVLYCSQARLSDDDRFTAPTYGHSPWLATGETWWRIVLSGSGLELGYPDRWLANACRNAGVPLYGIEGGFSEDKPWTLATDIDAIVARDVGCWCFHGLKSLHMYEALANNAFAV